MAGSGLSLQELHEREPSFRRWGLDQLREHRVVERADEQCVGCIRIVRVAVPSELFGGSQRQFVEDRGPGAAMVEEPKLQLAPTGEDEFARRNFRELDHQVGILGAPLILPAAVFQFAPLHLD